MAKVQNTFLKSKMNKDLDARILPEGEYRDAQNAQISKSEGSQVGSLENILGNVAIQDYKALTGVGDITCMGSFSDEINNTVYLFFTNYTDLNPNRYVYNPTAKNFIISTNVLSNLSTVLVEGEFLNFSTTNQITGVNVLENLLFFTDNRNQPRVINIELANPTPQSSPTFYTTEDQISVAKYNPYNCMELWEKSVLSPGDYETTMKDVSSLFLPNGGKALSTSQQTSQTINIDNIVGEIQAGTSNFYNQPATVSLLNTQDNTLTDTGFVVNSISLATSPAPTGSYNIFLSGAITVANNQALVFNSNPYYQATFGGDPDYLESKFARFSYRFRFVDNEYSIFAPFTQIAFIPKQDGYFMFAESPSQEKNDQDEAYRSSVVYFVENKVNSIDLRIPLPFTNYTLENALKIKEIDILYKESDAVAVKVVETVPIDKVYNQSAVCLTDISVVGPSTIIPVKNIQGGVSPGDLISGVGIPEGTTVVSFTPTNPSNQFNGNILISPTALTLDDDVLLTIGSPNYFVFKYRSTKPTKTLPSADLVRVFDKIPVRALAQEVTGNRVMYGNFLNKIDPPAFIDYNVAVTAKSDFGLNEVSANYVGTGTIPSGEPLDIDLINLIPSPGGFFPGAVVSSNEFGVDIPSGTVVQSSNNNGFGVIVTSEVVNTNVGSIITVGNISNFIPIGSELSGSFGATGLLVTGTTEMSEGVWNIQLNGVASSTVGQTATFTLANSTETIITLSNTVTFPVGSVILIFEPGGQVENTTSKIEYPSSSVKGNRNYQVGFVLSDRYGRQSSVILSNNETSIIVNGREYAGSTLYSPYINEELDGGVTDWPGNSLKILVNNPINGNRYNGDTSSLEYNPLGWYSYKIVVKQTEQEYYNVYLPGIMASYPVDQTLEIGQTSHTVLINDNINKIPRDLTEVGPDQKQFRSSVQLFGRVQNVIPTNPITSGETNVQYYPGTSTDTVTVISTLNDLFDFDPSNPKQPNLFPQFYSLESNPLIARISTVSQIGQLANTNFSPSSGKIISDPAQQASPDPITSNSFLVSSVSNNPAASSLVNALVSGQGVPDDTYIASNTPVGGGTTPTAGVMDITLKGKDGLTRTITLTPGVELVFTPTGGATSIPAFALDTPGIQYLAVYETEATESAIDIFWETSTSGVVSDLNDSILNNQSQPGGSNITWNPSDFTEGLAQDGFILNGNGFNVVDNFGVTITLNPNRLDPVTGAPDPDFVEIDSIFDNNNPPLNVNGDNTQRDYFRLVDTGFATGGGPWQIKTTSDTTPGVTGSNSYWENIYYGYNPGLERQFTFNFKIRVDGQDNIVTRTANLGNESPEFFLIEAIDNSGQVSYGPGANPPNQIPASVPIKSKKSNPIIARVWGNNGAANQVSGGVSFFPALSDLDVEFVDQGDGTKVWDQRIGNAAGVPALIDGSPIFELAGGTALQGQIQGLLFNSAYENPGLAAALYIVTLAIQDGGTIVFQQFEIDMRLELQNNNIWNKLQQQDSHEMSAIGPAIVEPARLAPNQWYNQEGSGGEVCGNNCLRSGTQTKWHYFPSTLIRIKQDTPGAGINDVGWYIYAAGFFQNNDQNMSSCCSPRVSGSIDLIDYSTGIVPGNSNTITIPKNTPLGSVGHKVQFQDLSLFPNAANWKEPPLIKSLIKVTGSTDGKTWNYENLVGELSGCEKLFVDRGATEVNGTYIPGNGWPDQNLTNSMGARTPRIKNISTVNLPFTGLQKKFYYDTTLISNSTSRPYVLDKNKSFPQYAYSYHGGFNANTSPWYFAPGDNSEALQNVWSMYTYSEWLASAWRYDHSKYVGWAPPFEPSPYAVSDGPALTALGVQQGVQAQFSSMCTSTCSGGIDTPALFCGQAVRPTNVSQFNFSII